MKIVLKRVRLAFPVLWEPKAKKAGDKPSCGASLIFSGDSDNHKVMREAIVQSANEKWQTKANDILKQLKAANKLCLYDGALKAQFAGFEGNMYVAARNPARPMVLSRTRTPLTERDGVIYAGCIVNASVDVWAMDSSEHGKRVCAKLLAVQFVEDAPAFGGGEQASADDFEDLGGGDDPFAETGSARKPGATGFADMDDDIPF